MKVFVVDPSLFTLPYDSHFCNGLAENGHEVVLFGRALRPGEQLGNEHRFTFRAFFYNLSERIPASIRAGRTLRAIFKACEHGIDTFLFARAVLREKPSAIHYQWMPLPMIDRFAIAQFKKRGIPVFFTVHDTNPFNAAPTLKGQRLGWKKNLLCFNALFVHTEPSRSALEQYGIPSHKIVLIAHGLLSFGPSERAPKKNGKTILFFGTIKPYKGLSILLRAFKKVSAAQPDIQLKIVGSCQNDDIASYHALIKELGISRSVSLEVRFFDDREIPALFAEADLIAFPYLQIDGSGALLTALAYEKPLIASDIGAFHELLSAYPNFLVPANDEEALAERLIRTLSHPDMLAKLHDQAKRVKAAIPSWKSVGAMTTAVYQQFHD